MSLDSKVRALSHFSITFMGKTKAGKSTLHAVVTGEGWNAIGIGKQRTTRLNRVYEWKHIRIIDTPGIGAPDGRSDEEIAESVIDESDVICYVVTNDSIQESEFKFLSLLESKSKPLIILLNLKNNLRDARRLKSFLDNPEKLFSMKGNNDLTGHIDRIRTYAQKHYSNNSFEIIPVMLLAAQLSQEEAHKEIKSDLLKASKLKNFLDIIHGFNLKIGGRILAVAGVLIGFVFPPLGIVIGAVGAVLSWFGGFFKSDEDKRREAVEKIEKALKSQIDIQESQIIEQANENLHKQCQNISSAVDVYLGGLIVGLEVMLKELTEAEKKLQLIIRELNFGYSKRILDYCQNKYEHLTLGTARADISSVDRDFGKQITIDLNSNYTASTNLLDPKYQESIGKILQERVSITQSKKTKLSNIYN